MREKEIKLDYIPSGYKNDVLYFLRKLEKYSEETFVHSKDVAEKALYLGKEFGLNKKELEELYTAGLVHDVGKLRVPIEILEGTNLTPEEIQFIKDVHIEETRRLLVGKFNKRIRDLAYRHHEKINGTGYPNMLSGNQLSLSNRILVVADITSALLMERSNKDAFSIRKSKDILRNMVEKGELDKDIVDVCIANIKDIDNL